MMDHYCTQPRAFLLQSAALVSTAAAVALLIPRRQLSISQRCVMTSMAVEARVFTCPPAKFSSPHLLLDPCHDSNLTAFPLFAPAPTSPSPSHFDRATTN
ncbi:uncharacterized protein RHO25_009208 [Cercospora beticola]|uniref:Secreted protein n=1 Tax=Cercospora beticola TaxID=122368 RepID=A0ABZ0NYM7_CERBT|nr:hypothetical protein RHO25_009208 [Cercospora beticola]